MTAIKPLKKRYDCFVDEEKPLLFLCCVGLFLSSSLVISIRKRILKEFFLLRQLAKKYGFESADVSNAWYELYFRQFGVENKKCLTPILENKKCLTPILSGCIVFD